MNHGYGRSNNIKEAALKLTLVHVYYKEHPSCGWETWPSVATTTEKGVPYPVVCYPYRFTPGPPSKCMMIRNDLHRHTASSRPFSVEECHSGKPHIQSPDLCFLLQKWRLSNPVVFVMFHGSGYHTRHRFFRAALVYFPKFVHSFSKMNLIS